MPRSDNDDNYHDMEAQQQFDQRQQDDRARQDAMLDQIHGGVVGLKNQAHAINGEVVEQNVMIDEIGTRMDDTTQDVSREEQAAREVNNRKKTACKLYGVIALLVVILIVVFVIPSPTK